MKTSVPLPIVLLLGLLASCDKAGSEYAKCVQLDTAGDVGGAWTACNDAIAADPLSKSAKDAANQLRALKPSHDLWLGEQAAKAAKEAARQAAELAEEKKVEAAEAERKANVERDHWLSIRTTLNDKLRQQAMWDLGRGTVTSAMTVITAEIGQPTGNYEGAYGAILSYVWGVQLGQSVSLEQIHSAPFAISMPRNMACGDYGGGETEFYSYGKRI